MTASGARASRDDVRHPGGIGALDRNQHHAGIAKDGGIFGQRELVRFYRAIEAFKARQPQPVGLDFGDHPRPRQQRDIPAGSRQHAADEAADAAGPAMPIGRSDSFVCLLLTHRSTKPR